MPEWDRSSFCRMTQSPTQSGHIQLNLDRTDRRCHPFLKQCLKGKKINALLKRQKPSSKKAEKKRNLKIIRKDWTYTPTEGMHFWLAARYVMLIQKHGILPKLDPIG